MHELAVTESILNIAKEHAIKNQARQVTDIHLVVGALSSLVNDSVQFYWDILTQDSLCAGSKLHFKREPAELLCLDCSNQYRLDKELTPCPTCQSAHVKVISGDQFWLDSIEITR